MTEEQPAELPGNIIFDPNNPPNLEDLPELPEGYVWGITVTADIEVVHPDGTKD